MSATKEQKMEGVPADGEMAEQRWSVVSFERVEQSGLTYDEARSVLVNLDGKKIPGLCIVTDEAAGRFRPS